MGTKITLDEAEKKLDALYPEILRAISNDVIAQLEADRAGYRPDRDNNKITKHRKSRKQYVHTPSEHSLLESNK